MAKKKNNSERSSFHTMKVLVPWILSTIALTTVGIAGIITFQSIERMLIDDPRFKLGAADQFGDLKPKIDLSGVHHASLQRVMDVFEKDAGRSLYLFPLEDRRRELLSIDWVRNVSVARIWPDRLEVRIKERQPVAFVQLPPQQSGALYNVALIDEEGVILEKPPGTAYDLPILTGIREDQSVSMRAMRVKRMQYLCAEVKELCGRISEVDVAEPNNVKIRMTANGDSVLMVLGRDNYMARVRRFLDHYGEIHRRLPTATHFDLRLDDRITALDGVS